MLLEKNTVQIEQDEKSINETKKTSKKEINKIQRPIALVTRKVICNIELQLEEGKELPEGVHEAFITSLRNSNLIK